MFPLGFAQGWVPRSQLLNCACTWMVPFHCQNLVKKLELQSVAELTKLAIRHWLTPLDHRSAD